MENSRILFIAGFGPIVPDTEASRKLYSDSLGIQFKEETGGYRHTESLEGAKSFALWPLSHAAQSIFEQDSWPANIPVPQAWLEFDVDDVEKATAELEAQGVRMLIKNKKEPCPGDKPSADSSPPKASSSASTLTPFLRKEK